MTGQLPLTGVGVAVTWYPLVAGGCSKAPLGPLPVEMVDLRVLAPVLIQLHVALGAVGALSITPVRCYRTGFSVM